MAPTIFTVTAKTGSWAARIWTRTLVIGILTRTRGFTLIEILTVIAAISVMLSLAMFSMSSVGLRKANNLAKETSFLMRTLSDEAIMSGRRYGLRLNEAQRRLTPVVLGGGGRGAGHFSFEPIAWDADMRVALASTDLGDDYRGANFNAPRQSHDDGEHAGPAIVFEPLGLWRSRGNSLVFSHDGRPVKRLTWTAIGHIEVIAFESDGL